MNFKTVFFGTALMIGQLSFAEGEAPHLWWGHEALTSDVEKCVLKSQVALLENGFKSVSVNNEYHFLYATKGEMRAGVQCMVQDNGSFVYVNVAGSNVNAVEENRNKLLSSIN